MNHAMNREGHVRANLMPPVTRTSLIHCNNDDDDNNDNEEESLSA